MLPGVRGRGDAGRDWSGVGSAVICSVKIVGVGGFGVGGVIVVIGHVDFNEF
jgi:hypothetical protein